jgi:hypothetical protein
VPSGKEYPALPSILGELHFFMLLDNPFSINIPSIPKAIFLYLSAWSRMEIGTLKVHKKKVGRADSTELTKVSLPGS